MAQDALDHGGVFDHRNELQAPATPGAFEDIEPNAPADELRPETVRRGRGGPQLPTHPWSLQAVPLGGRHAERGMEIEAVVARLTRPEPWRVGDGGQGGAAATDPGAVFGVNRLED